VGAAPWSDGSTTNATFPAGGNNFQHPDLKVTAAPDLPVTAGTVPTGTSIALGALAANGGTTFTRSIPAAPNAALNGGTAAGAPSHDQRGNARSGLPDIGAFDRQPSDP
jgi:hypothetical protein